ncbi:MAG: hypothetical protein Q8O26_19370 [Phreatobacter sp.]|uniref:hypothetical protein n=1 Tax=Phreatobacter sp. TaxID=1966341 RepID=UPI00273432B6|nr:hypothetical protein [Phreatobacter sp.]MDP2804036.1 hypothetical protein [Phreatobacter sp.]
MAPNDKQTSTPPTVYLGIAFCLVSVVWWFVYYAQYGGAFGLIGLKLACIGFATPECAFFQANIRGAIPRYVPVLWYAGMVTLAFGVFQIWRQRQP